MRSSSLLEIVEPAAAPLVLADHLLERFVVVGHPAPVTAGVQKRLFLGVMQAVAEVPEEADHFTHEVCPDGAGGLDVAAFGFGGGGDLEHQAVLRLQDLPPAHGSSFHELPGPHSHATPFTINVPPRGA